MKKRVKLLPGKLAAWALWPLAFMFIAFVAAGCGDQTGQANQLIAEVNDITAATKPKLDEANALLTRALGQLRAGQLEAERVTLTSAQQLLDEIIPEIMRAKEKTDEASALNISDSFRLYLQAKAMSLEALLRLTEVDREYTNIFLADPLLENPESQPKIAELQQVIIDQVTRINEAEAEANRIASEDSEIRQ